MPFKGGNGHAEWPEERIARLIPLWDSGLPITKIGRELGVSPGAVAGKVHRLGLKPRPSPIKRGQPRLMKRSQKTTLPPLACLNV